LGPALESAIQQQQFTPEQEAFVRQLVQDQGGMDGESSGELSSEPEEYEGCEQQADGAAHQGKSQLVLPLCVEQPLLGMQQVMELLTWQQQHHHQQLKHRML
jgi:hypothetical protein